MRHPIITILLILVGTGLFGGGYYFSKSKADAVAGMEPVSGVVLSHEFSVDGARWKGRETKAMRLETKIQGQSTGSFGILTEYFGDSASAYEWMADHPVGATIECLSQPNGTGFAWPSRWFSGPRIAMILGVALVSLGGLWLWKFPQWQIPQEAWVVSVFAVFAVAGGLTAWAIWPGVKKQIQAATWGLVPYEQVEERSRGRGRGRSNRQSVLRYQYEGKSYLVLIRSHEPRFFDVPQHPTHCMVNPAEPWICARSWGWRPAVGMALFPVPFIGVGCLGLLLLVPGWRKHSKKSKQRKGKPSVLVKKLEGIAIHGYFLLLFGSFVGFFVAACGELWLQQRDGRLFVSIFLIPFVAWVLWLAWRFFRVISSLWRSDPIDMTLVVVPFTKQKRARKR